MFGWPPRELRALRAARRCATKAGHAGPSQGRDCHCCKPPQSHPTRPPTQPPTNPPIHKLHPPTNPPHPPSIESWKLAEIRRDDYAPNGGGQKAWEFDRKRWLAGRLGDVMKEAGYSGQELALVEDVMMARDVPNPRDMRLHDLVGPFGLVNNRLLLAACVMQARGCLGGAAGAAVVGWGACGLGLWPQMTGLGG